MNDGFAVREREPVGHLGRDVDDHGHRQDGAGIEDLAQRASGEEFHRDIGDVVTFANIMDRDNVGVVQAAGRARLAEETLAKCGRFGTAQVDPDGLQREQPLDQRIARFVHDTHVAATEFAKNLVAADLRRRRSDRHVGYF